MYPVRICMRIDQYPKTTMHKKIIFWSLGLALAACSGESNPQNATQDSQVSLPDDYAYSLEKAFILPDEVKELRLGNQNLQSLPDSFARFQNLEILYLSDNPSLDFDQVFPMLVKLPKLRELSLNGLDLKTIPSGIANMKELSHLWLDGNPHLDYPALLTALAGLPRLQELSLNDDSLSDLPGIENLSNLQTLYLDRNELSVLPTGITHLKSLHTLSLQGNTSLRLGPLFEELAQLEGLEVLLLNLCRIKELPATLSQLKQLEILWLNANVIEKLPESISQMPGLKEVYIQGNPLEAEAIQKLVESAPQITFEYDKVVQESS